jgi:AcrR family transcriptional regulator
MSSTPSHSPIAPDTRERILDAAEALFAEHGLAGTPVRDIARGVGVTPASLYNHFEGKQALYEAVLERGVRPLFEIMQRMPSYDQAAEAIDDLIGAIMKHLAARPHLPRLIQHEVVSGGAYLKQLSRHWLRPLIEQSMAGMKRDGDPVWEEQEYPLLISAWLNVVFGHFAMASVLADVLESDPLSPEALERQTRFLRKLARIMMLGASADASPRG